MIKLVSIILFSVLIFSFGNVGFTQGNFKLSINSDIYVVLKYDSVHLDSLSVFNEIERNHTIFKSKGYISSYYKTVKLSDSSFSSSFILGELYSWKYLTISPLIEQITSDSEKFRSYPFRIKTLEIEINNILTQCQNRGYPFAQVYFDSVHFIQGKINAKLELNLNDFVIIDSVIVKGGLKTSLNYVEKQIGISKGEIYNEKKIKDINKKIGNITFVETIRSPEVYFTPGKATLVLYLKDKTASRFDGILGLNPDEATGKIGITGDLKVDLLNAFKKGENIILNWEQAKTKSQNYLIRFSYPFLFKTRIGLETGLNYYRQDTSFANLDADFGFSFFLDEKQKVGISAQFIESNSLLGSQSNLVGLPSTNSVSVIYYGVNYTYNSLDYRLNPRRGLTIGAGLKSGNKTIVKNPDYKALEYENLEEKTIQIKTDVTISYFLPIFKKSTVLLKLQSGNVFGDNIFLNELYQVGGLKTLRGFNQQSIIASNYYIGTTEFRYLFEKNSAVFGYLDFGYYENKSTATFETDTPFGFGIGTNFQTKAGIFSLSYGLGKQKGNPILFKNGKIHFGFVSLF
jgi:hypothetical protein